MAKLRLAHPEFRHPRSTICGTGSIRILAHVGGSATAFLTTAQDSVIERVGGAFSRGGGSLSSANHVTKPPGEPTRDSLAGAAEFLRSGCFERIVAVGGGSVLDWARLAWARSLGALDQEDGVLVEAIDEAPRPEFWLVPTTCGTGAEAADVAVFQCGAAGTKTAVVSRAFLADKVVLDGGFLESLASPQLASFVCDALTHAVEASLSIVPLTLGKEAAISALDLIVSSYHLEDGSSRRDKLMEAAFLGGVAAANCSVGIVHAFAHSVGRDGLAHGVANACALRAGLQFNADTPQMEKLLRRVGATSCGDLSERVRPIVSCALEGIWRHPVVTKLQQPQYRQLVADRMASDTALRSNPRRASGEDLLRFVNDVAEQVSKP